jgi:hypothetical protein
MDWELPQLDERPVLITLVREDSRGITHSIFLEAVPELCALGEEPLSKKDWKEAARMLLQLCEVYSISTVRAFAPEAALAPTKRKRLSAVERMLTYFGFAREDTSRLVPFTRQIAVKKPATVAAGENHG